MKRGAAPAAVVARVRRICDALPQVVEEGAEEGCWVGTRWRVCRQTFAHVLAVQAGWPPAYARALGPLHAPAPEGATCVLTFRSPLCALNVHAFDTPPFFKPRWFADIAGVVLDARTDWTEVEALLRDSWCHLAPKALAASLAPS